MEPLVSVIIPTYKGNEMLSRAIGSVLEQTYSNVEVIVVDDNGIGSTDQVRTEKEVSKFDKDTRFKYIAHNENRNGSAARNTGLEHSSGEYICFLDDDDYFKPEKIEWQIKKFLSCDSDVGVIYCGVEIHENRKIIEQYPVHKGYIAKEILMRNAEICSSSLMIRRDVLLQIGGFDETFARHQDWEMLVRLTFKWKAEFINEVLVVKEMIYRNYPQNADVVANNRLYYLKKMEPIINTMSKAEVSRIYSVHYLEIARVYFVNGDILRWWKYSKKSKRPLKSVYLSGKGLIHKMIAGVVRK